jgi:hypothetical protein
MRVGHGLAWIAAAIVVWACETQPSTLLLPAHDLGSEAEGATYDGTLAQAGQCLWLDVDGHELNLLWPAGYRWFGEPATVVTATGQELVRVGDRMVFGGFPIRDATAPPGCPTRRAAAVGVVVEVNGIRVGPTDPRPARSPSRPLR